MSIQSCAEVPCLRHGLGSGTVVTQQPESLTWAKTSCAHTAAHSIPVPVPGMWSGAVPICQLSLPTRWGPGNITENSAQTQAVSIPHIFLLP